MKITHLSRILGASAFALLLTGCIEDTNPTSGMTGEQVKTADVAGLSRAVMAYMNKCNGYSDGGGSDDIGYPGFMIWRESMTADFAPVSNIYDYYPYFYNRTWLGDYAIQSRIWDRHYGLVHSANLLLERGNPERAEERPYIGNALAYRALAYMDLMRMYEYRLTGVESLDAKAKSDGIVGLTVPIVDEKTTEKEAKNNPRAPFYQMYRFILTDLNRAMQYLQGYEVGAKNEASLGVVYGLQARLWLEMATRWRLHPADLAEMNAHEGDEALKALDKIGVNNAADSYRRAAEYADRAIDCGYQPLAQTQWYDTSNGFNTPNDAWMWAVIISSNDDAAYLSWQSFVSYTCPEASWGVAGTQYMAARMIDAALFWTIPQGDWRRDTWTDPAEAGDPVAFQMKYSHVTSLNYNDWNKLGAYVGYKFHPAGGDTQTSNNGNAVSIPLMRVEEMWLIKAEAEGCANGVDAGRSVLENFINSYRWRGGMAYECRATTIEDFVNEVVDQKRIEFWGESVTPWDYKRLGRAIIRDYPGNNHTELGQVHSNEGFAAPWMNLYIPDAEHNYNPAVVLNPDPSGAL